MLAAKANAAVGVGVGGSQIAVSRVLEIDGLRGGGPGLHSPAGLPGTPVPDAFTQGDGIRGAVGDAANPGAPVTASEQAAAIAANGLSVARCPGRSGGSGAVGVVAKIILRAARNEVLARRWCFGMMGVGV